MIKSHFVEALDLLEKNLSDPTIKTHTEMYKKIASQLNIKPATVYRYLNKPTKNEAEHFRQCRPYGLRKVDGKYEFFNRRYESLPHYHVEHDCADNEYYYNDGTDWLERFYNSAGRDNIYTYALQDMPCS